MRASLTTAALLQSQCSSTSALCTQRHHQLLRPQSFCLSHSSSQDLTWHRGLDLRRSSCSSSHRVSRVNMTLQKLPRRTLRVLLPRVPTWEQWVSYWGSTPRERQGRVMSAIGYGFLWLWCGFFLSSTILGSAAMRLFRSLLFARFLLAPLYASYQRNMGVRGGNEGHIWGALFSGEVVAAQEVAAPSAVTDHLHFCMKVRDGRGRELTFEVPAIPAYSRIRPHMRCEVVVISRDPEFTALTGITEAYIPAAAVFVGEHPLLRRHAFLKLLDRRRAKARKAHIAKKQRHLNELWSRRFSHAPDDLVADAAAERNSTGRYSDSRYTEMSV